MQPAPAISHAVGPPRSMQLLTFVCVMLFVSVSRLWNMQGFTLLSRTTVDAAVRSCAFSHDGSMLAVGLSDGSFLVLKTK